VRAYLTPTEPSPTRKHRELNSGQYLTAESAEIQQAFKLIRQQGAASTLFSDALDILNEQFGLVRADLQPYFDALEVSPDYFVSLTRRRRRKRTTRWSSASWPRFLSAQSRGSARGLARCAFSTSEYTVERC